MIIVIDGYNLLHAIFTSHRGKFDRERIQLVRQLSYYQRQKNHEIILVFDGGLFSHATREVRSGIVVIYSGQRESADEWIVDYIARHKGKEILLVTRDRNLIAQSTLPGVDVIDVVEFYNIVNNVMLENAVAVISEKKSMSSEDNIIKFMHEDEFHDESMQRAIDTLMAQAQVSDILKKEEPEGIKRHKKSMMPTKHEKKLRKKINKL